MSKVAVCDDALINTKGLRHKIKLNETNFDPNFLTAGNHADNFRFIQCGNSIISINEYLEKTTQPPKSIRVSGGSNGQTIVGAFSTGTHGSALFFGALSEMVVGMHIITGPDSHVYIERKSRVVTSGVFHAKLGAEVIIDDELFNAALVSFGSFGIIHGVLIEVEDKFLLKQKLARIPFDDTLEQALLLNDFSLIQQHLAYPIDDPDHQLYHFELAINPHDFAFNDPTKGVYLRSMFKAALQAYEPIVADEKYSYGDDTLGLIQSVLDNIEASAGFINRLLVPKIVNVLFNLAYNRPEQATGTIGETFNSTKFRGNLFSAAFGIDRKDVRAVINECLNINKRTSLAGVMAFRFVRGTNATLGFTKWEHSCVLELDGADASINHEFVKKLAENLEAQGIGYTLHWGKINRILNKERLAWMYGNEKINAWKAQRSRILTEAVQRVFNNEFMGQTGLDEYIPYLKPDPDIFV
jgi:hypothetical protein